MPGTIKTREVIKDIKTLDKKRAMTEGFHSAYAKTREVAEQGTSNNQPHHQGCDYAQDRIEQAGKTAAKTTRRTALGGSKKAINANRDLRHATGDTRRATQGAKQAAQTAGRKTANVAKATEKVSERGIKRSANGTVKTVGRSIKTAEQTARTTVKTSQQAARGATAAVRASQIAARNAARAARTSAKAGAATAKAAVRAIATFVKMAIAAIKSLVTAIAAGGWVAMVVIVIICLIGLVAVSAYGIFFTGGDMGDGNPSLREVVQEINDEYNKRIEDIKEASTYDELSIVGSRGNWKEVLAVFAVKTTTDPDKPLDVVTLDEKRQQLLRGIFWDMNTIESRIEEREVTEIALVEDESGKPHETTKTHTVKTLYVTTTSKSVDEAAVSYGFAVKQKDLLVELLSSRYDSAWQSVLYGIRSGSGDIVEVAASQIGNVGGQPYWSWYGFSGRVEWCACFVSWCANECGYIEEGILPRHSYCQTGINWFRDAGCWRDARSGYEPKPGDIIYFDWGDGGDADHVGIVEFCDGITVYTIEGNSSDGVHRCSYRINSPFIIGYGCLCK